LEWANGLRRQVDEASLPAIKNLLDSQLDLSLERLLAGEWGESR
jgi:hypothetical protein